MKGGYYSSVDLLSAKYTI